MCGDLDGEEESRSILRDMVNRRSSMVSHRDHPSNSIEMFPRSSVYER